MASFENQQTSARRYAASSSAFFMVTRIVAGLFFVATAIIFALGFFEAIDQNLTFFAAIVMLLVAGLVVLIGNVIKNQSEAILAILDTVSEQQQKQDSTDEAPSNVWD